MRISSKMQQQVDNTGWATFATAIGMLIGTHGLVRYAVAMLTLASGIVVSHFLKIALNRYFPPRSRAERQDSE